MTAAAEVTAGSFERGALVAGRWRIEAPLGHGGAGSVYRVYDEREQRMLALKQLRLGSEKHAAVLALQFEREYYTLSQLAHPNIIEVYDYGVEGGSAFYTMELLDGEDLSERGKIAWRPACALLRDVASSLAVLHSRRMIHRDVTARNVRCTADGNAKLIDFGAMTPMGVSKHIVGTPPFIPPEATQLQSLDARADLYALGALAYWTLTGRHAYPARTLGQLPGLWRSALTSARKFDPEIPEGLDRLVLELLQLDRAARPRTAAEVIERLSGIAQLPLQEDTAVGKAYLYAPSLVGRDELLAEAKSALTQAAAGHGTTLLIEGAGGSGRTRLLEACLLEAKLLGAVVLRADASDAAQGEYGTVRALCNQLLRTIPELAKHSVQPPQKALLGHVIPAFSERRAERVERRHVQSTLRDWFLSIARHRHLVIAVDDLERVDEPSAAVLGAIAHRAERRQLSLLLSLRSGSAPTPALSVVREVAQVLQLEPLRPEQTEALLCSVFGDVQHVAALARRIHAAAGGNPQSTMALAQHLCERGIARYEAGSFKLPTELRADDLPASVTEAFSLRLQALSADARELGSALSLDDPASLPLLEYAALTDHADHARTYRAIDEMVSSGVLVAANERYRFSHESIGAQLRAGLPPQRAATLHLRLARAFENCNDRMRSAQHLIFGGREREGVELLIRLHELESVELTPERFVLLERAHEAATRLQMPERTRFVLQQIIVTTAAYFGESAPFERYAHHLLSRLRRDSGLDDFHALPSSMDEGARAAEAQRRAQARYDAAAEAERVYAPGAAATALARLSTSFVAMASVVQQLPVVAGFPDLLPLAPLWPGLRVAQANIEGGRAMQQGRYEKVVPLCNQMLAAFRKEDLTGLARADAERMRWGALYMQGLFAALTGGHRAADRVAELEQIPGQRGNAWRVRMVSELMHGDIEAAHRSQRRSELLYLQDGAALILPGTTLRIELQAYIAMDDLIGVKRTMERIEPWAALHPGWEPTLGVARLHYRRLQGDPQGALLELPGVLCKAAPAQHFDWGLLAEAHVALLLQVGRNDEALAQAQAYVAMCEREQLPVTRSDLLGVLAEAFLAVGRLDDALATNAELLELHRRYKSAGLRLGRAYETRVRIAIAMHDDAAVQSYAELCAKEYKGARNTQLAGKYQRLMRSAQDAGIQVSTGLHHAADISIAVMARADAVDTLHSRLQTCIGDAERAQAGLSLLLESSGARTGYLFGLRTGQLELLSSSDGSQPSDELIATLESYVREEFEGEASATVLATHELAAPPLHRWADAWGREYEPMLLFSKRGGESTVAGVAALHYEGDERPLLKRGVLEALTEALVESDAVDPVTYVV